MCSIAGGLFTLVGIWIAAELHLRNKHKTWLMERRAEVFVEFLNRLDNCFHGLSDIEKEIEEKCERSQWKQEWKIALTENYVPVSEQEKRVRLYISSEAKESFSILVKNIKGIYTDLDSPSGSRGNIYCYIDDIQKIFEDDIPVNTLCNTCKCLTHLINKCRL